MVDPMHFPRAFVGTILLLLGIVCAVFAHYSLLWKVDSWMLGKRLAFGIPGWGLAAILIWHGFTLLITQ